VPAVQRSAASEDGNREYRTKHKNQTSAFSCQHFIPSSLGPLRMQTGFSFLPFRISMKLTFMLSRFDGVRDGLASLSCGIQHGRQSGRNPHERVLASPDLQTAGEIRRCGLRARRLWFRLASQVLKRANPTIVAWATVRRPLWHASYKPVSREFGCPATHFDASATTRPVWRIVRDVPGGLLLPDALVFVGLSSSGGCILN